MDVQAQKREADGSTSEYAVEDHAWRLYRDGGGDVNALPDYFVSALAMSAQDHIAMMEAVQPFVDTAISKTVNIPADYPYEDLGPVPAGLARTAQRPGHLPAQRHPGLCAGSEHARPGTGRCSPDACARSTRGGLPCAR